MSPRERDATRDLSPEEPGVASEERLALRHVHGGELPAMCVDLDGLRVNLRTRVDRPERFSELFLRDAEDLDASQFCEILNALVLDVCARWMQAQGHATASPALVHELEIAAGAALASCGLELLGLDLLGGSSASAIAEPHLA